MAQTDDDKRGVGQRFRDFHTRQVITPLVVLLLLFILLMSALTKVVDDLQSGDADVPENILPILLVFGTLALLVSLASVVVVFARLDLTSWRSPLGLPEGSIRAIIALLLIVLFFITAIFLYADVGRGGESRVLQGVDAAFLAREPNDHILGQKPSATGPEGTFDVVLSSPKNEASRDIAKQLVTTVSTLVVAVAAFYFGANSVQTAVAAREPRTRDGATV